MRRVLSTSLILWAWATPVWAAEVRTDAACYREGASVGMTATGFKPGSVFSAILDGAAIGGGLVEQAGAVQADFRAPSLARGEREKAHAIGVIDDAGAAAATTFLVSRPSATVMPRPRNPRTARVRFKVYGMGAGRPEIAVDWIDPRGILIGSAQLGRAAGVCGRLITSTRRLLPFAPRRGTWRLRFHARSSGGAQVTLRLRVTER